MNDEMTNKVKETICVEQTNETLKRIENLKKLHVLDDLPECDQMSLF